MQFNELRGLVDEIQETSRYDTSATEDLHENENQDAIANPKEEIAEQVLLDANEENFDQHKPKKHDRISFFCKNRSEWLTVTLTSAGIKRYGGHYCNYELDDGTKGGVDLLPGTA